MTRMVLGLMLYWVSVCLGYLARRGGRVDHTFSQRWIPLMVGWCFPLITCLAVWNTILTFRHAALIGFPFVGIMICSASLIPAWWMARRWPLTREQRGCWLIAAFFSNVGFMGAIIAFALWGEDAYGLCTLFFLFFTVAVYTLGYSVGSSYGNDIPPQSWREFMAHPWRWAPFIGVMLGVVLGWCAVPRPAWLAAANYVLIPTVTSAYIFTIGTSLQLGRMRAFVRPALAMCVIKLLYAPLVGATLAWSLGYHHLYDGLLFKITLLESSMPVAAVAVALATLFKMDQDFANALWIVSGVMSIVTIPIVLILLQYFP